MSPNPDDLNPEGPRDTDDQPRRFPSEEPIDQADDDPDYLEDDDEDADDAEADPDAEQ